MSLAIFPTELAKINEHARRDYPHECCGMMLGKEVNGWKLVTEARPINNARDDSPRNRFLITPDDFRANERYAREQKLDILGFYHSHPDHPARPSEFDRQNAWPWFSYVIVSVAQGVPGEVTSWELAWDRSQFHRETLETAFRTLEELEQHAR
ncbi:MAG: Mov34/MPN/PAD-1 family protein [bacterium]